MCIRDSLLEAHDLCGEMLMTVNRYLETKGIRITTGTKMCIRDRACRDSNPEPRDYESPALTVELQALQ